MREKTILRRAVALLLSLSCCLSLLCFAGCSGNGEEGETAVSESTVAAEDGLLYDDNGIPYISETFESGKTTAQERGEGSVVLELLDRADEEGGKALKISGRTSDWNGANFPADAFRGNTIRASADIMTSNSTARISLQYELSGAPNYSWIVSSPVASDKYTTIVGEATIPENAANVFVYIEADSTADICVDNLKVTVKGDYIEPKAAESVVYADYTQYESLAEVYAPYFNIGVAIPTTFVDNDIAEFTGLVTHEFNCVTLENEMKPEAILDKETSQADPEKYNESPALKFDQLPATLDFCKENGLAVRGHTLVWHSQCPEWIFYEDYDTSKELVGRDLMLTRMENYIKGVFEWADENYPGLFYAWDVVNEAIDDQTNTVREWLWYQTIGEDYVERAFEYARRYAPEGVKLFYNDYNSYQPAKRSGIIKLLEPIAAAGNLDGVGMQGHINCDCSIDSFVTSAKMYADTLGVVVNVTELDIEMPNTEDGEYEQGEYYRELFGELIAAKKEGLPLEAVTVWGVCDTLSWKSATKPLLFNADLSKKSAFDGLIEAAAQTK